MIAAIYARYSSDLQKSESIDDQINSCLFYAQQKDYITDSKYIYTDYAVSGKVFNRSGLTRMIEDSGKKIFDVILIDDLSRLSRDNAQLLEIIKITKFHNVNIISIADNICTNSDESKIGYQLRGIMNELYIDDLRKKTLRGQLGQLNRGFFIGVSTFGYKTYTVGVADVDRGGHPVPQGSKVKIDDAESKIVQRVFDNFAKGKSVNAIVKELNTEKVPSRKNAEGAWAPATISYMLKNRRYIGEWCWGSRTGKQDPVTGKTRFILRDEGPLVSAQIEELRIISAETWEKVAKRFEEVTKVWPGGKQKGFSNQNGSEVKVFPKELLSGAMCCSECGCLIGKASGTRGGYYGCLNARLGKCNNTIIVRKSLVENKILSSLIQLLSDTNNIHSILKKVEKHIADLCKNIPSDIYSKKIEVHTIENKISNLVNFVVSGDTSEAVRVRLRTYESKLMCLNNELNELEETTKNVFVAPPVEWIRERVSNLKEVLEMRVEESALLLRNILGTIYLKPVTPDIGKPYLNAVADLHVWALIEKKRPQKTWPLKPERYNSSNSMIWRPLQDSNLRPTA